LTLNHTSGPWSTWVDCGPECIVDKSGLWTEVDWSGSWTTVDQSEALYRRLWSITCLCSPNWLSQGKPLKIAPEAIYTSSFMYTSRLYYQHLDYVLCRIDFIYNVKHCCKHLLNTRCLALHPWQICLVIRGLIHEANLQQFLS